MSALADFQKRVVELEKRVEVLTREKEDLYRDVERICLNSDSSFWSTSSVLSQRIVHNEREIVEYKKEIENLKGQRDSLREDNTQLRITKKDGDRLVKEEMDKNLALERELTFYKKHCAKALEDKNLFSYEVEELKRTNMELERFVQDAEAKLETEIFQREEIEARKRQAEDRVSHLEERLIECARIPELETQLRATRAENDELKSRISVLENAAKDYGEKYDTYREDYEQMKGINEALEEELQTLRKEAEIALNIEKNKVKQLEQKLIDTLNEFKMSQGELQDADAAVAAARAQVELTQADRSHEVELLKVDYESRVGELEQKIQSTEEMLTNKSLELQAAIEAKVTALEKASEWESRYSMLQQKLKEGDNKGYGKTKNESLFMEKRPLEGSSFTSKFPLKNAVSDTSSAFNIFKIHKKDSSEEVSKDLTTQIRVLNNVIERVSSLVPRFSNLYEKLEKADPVKTNSRRESQNRLEAVRKEMEKLKKELSEKSLNNTSHDSLHEAESIDKEDLERELGLSALRFVDYGIGRLRDVINVSQ